MKKLLIFASGSKDGGGSGARELIENARTGILQAEIVGLVSSRPEGGVFKIAQEYGIPFHYFEGPYEAEEYQKIIEKFQPDFIALSGWLKLAVGLNPKTTINIHPGPLPEFGGPGMFGHHVHKAIVERGAIESAVSMHFVTEEYDKGPVFFRYPVLVRKGEVADDLATRVNKIEHGWQSFITSLVISGQISWDGKDPDSLTVPDWYQFLPKK